MTATRSGLRKTSRKRGQPATEIVPEGSSLSLEARLRRAIRRKIKGYARAISGSRQDLDRELESVALEELFGSQGFDEGAVIFRRALARKQTRVTTFGASGADPYEGL